MDKQEALEIFIQIQQDYNRIKLPKYRGIELERWQKKYNELTNLKEFLSDDPLYLRLVNGLSQAIAKAEKLERSRTSEDSWNNTSERGINKALPALIRKPGTEIEFPYEWIDDKSGHKCSITNGYWGARNYMVMDALGREWQLGTIK